MDYKTAKIEDIVADAKKQGDEAIKLLKSFRDQKIIDKRGVERQVSFIKIKREYFKKYYPELLPKAKPKAKTINDWLDEL